MAVVRGKKRIIRYLHWFVKNTISWPAAQSSQVEGCKSLGWDPRRSSLGRPRARAMEMTNMGFVRWRRKEAEKENLPTDFTKLALNYTPATWMARVLSNPGQSNGDLQLWSPDGGSRKAPKTFWDNWHLADVEWFTAGNPMMADTTGAGTPVTACNSCECEGWCL